MIRYNYILDTETKEISHEVLETYPSTDILDKGIEAGRDPELIKKQQLKALQGEAEAPIVSIEEDWFNAYKKQYELNKELENIGLQLSGKEEVIDEETGVVIEPAVEAVTDEAVIEKLNERKAQLLDKTTYVFDDYGVKQPIVEKGEITQAVEGMEAIEKDNQWLLAYRGEETTEVRPEPAIEITSLPREQEKKLIAHERDLTVRNNEDSIADLAKMVSLSFSAISALWAITSDDAKANLPEATKATIDYAVQRFNEIETRADDQLAEEGVALVDKLYEREVAIAGIVRKYK